MSRKASLTLALLAFVLATPAARALCDAACTSASAGHHTSAPPADIHQGHHEEPSATPEIAASAADPAKCSVPAFDAVAPAKAKDSRVLMGLAVGPSILPTGVPPVFAWPSLSTSPPDTSPPALFALRI